MVPKPNLKGKSPASVEQAEQGEGQLWRRLWQSVLVFALFIGIPVLVFAVVVLRPIQPEFLSTENSDGVIITIKSGQSVAQISQNLAAKGVITDPFIFRLLVRLTGEGRKIQAGVYRVQGAKSALDILQILVAGKVELVQCTLPEGMTVVEVVAFCAQSGLGDKARYHALLKDESFRQKLNIKASTLEGYLFPETYRFAPGSSERTILQVMVSQTQQHLTKSLLGAAKKRGLNEFQLLTLASIIQKEAGNEQEMPRISAVFHNRLKRGMRLQADPTVIYGIKDFNGNLTRNDLRTSSPYNTYMKRGLPAGPIANSGLAALHAAAHPEVGNYLYFVATGEGGHYFSHTLKEHNRAVRRYQLKR
ncbi:MAG: endolytic transglycosylase MltG [Deltaproteobacteria bacterium]|nr:endolytic transglycosylase MltG [Deltaproteobacteria bacterium]